MLRNSSFGCPQQGYYLLQQEPGRHFGMEKKLSKVIKNKPVDVAESSRGWRRHAHQKIRTVRIRLQRARATIRSRRVSRS
eukprot:5714989-Ditylum_brightwellii.AAC.1